MGQSTPARLVEAVDSLRDVVFRNDCLPQAAELAKAVEDGQTRVAPSGEVVSFDVEALESAVTDLPHDDWFCEFVKVEATYNERRNTQVRQTDDKLTVLAAEHAERLQDRRAILNEKMQERLATEELKFN